MGPGLAVFGGTFDPVHLGHLRAAREVRQQLALEEVRLMPAALPPHRPAVASPATRCRMLELAVAGEPGLRVDKRELDSFRRNGEASFTVNSLRSLRAELGPEVPLLLVLGADAFRSLPGWRDWRELFALAHLLVLARPGYALETACLPAELQREIRGREVLPPELSRAAAGRIARLDIPPVQLAATELRRRLAEGKSVRHLVPEAVHLYLRERRLYRQDLHGQELYGRESPEEAERARHACTRTH